MNILNMGIASFRNVFSIQYLYASKTVYFLKVKKSSHQNQNQL